MREQIQAFSLSVGSPVVLFPLRPLEGLLQLILKKPEKNFDLSHVHTEPLHSVKPCIRLSLKGSGRLIFCLFM